MSAINIGVKLAGDGILAVCEACGLPYVHFEERHGNRRRCHKCCDEVQHRPTVVQSRECLWEMSGVRLISLPADWQSFLPQEGDQECFRIDLRGRIFGASWDGRLVIYTPGPELPKAGDIVRVRDMVVSHRTKVCVEAKPTLEHGMVTVAREVGLQSDEAGQETVLTRRYIVITLAPNVVPTGAELVWDTACTKTTLKGFGRQYWASVSGSPLHDWRISGGARSGRFNTTGVLAVVDQEHPLIIEGTGDVAFTRTHPDTGEDGGTD